MYHSFIFGTITIINIFNYMYYNCNKKHEKSLCLFFHLYFCILASFLYKDDDLIDCSTIYFVADSLINTYFNTFKIFNRFHHLFVLILIYFNEYLDKTIINFMGMHEVSTIVLCLIDLKIINKQLFEILFPLSFVLCRIIVFNYFLFFYVYDNYLYIPNVNYVVLFLLNTMNICIIIKMRLMQKIYKIFIHN